MYICYGISNGPRPLGPRADWEEDQWLWHAPIGCGVVVRDKDDLVLTVPDFDPTQSTAVKITLSRKGSDVPIVELVQNSFQLSGKPELVWGSSSVNS